MKSENRFCVYFHRNGVTDEIFYVGIGTGYRPKRFSGRNSMWTRVVKKYGYRIEIVHEELTWEEACRLEKDYIKKLGRRNLKAGSLTNLTDGGDGTPGCLWNIGSKRTPEQKAKISKALIGRKISPEAIAKSVSTKRNKREERIKSGILRPRKPLSEEDLQRIRTINIGRTWSNERREKHSLAFKGRKKSPEHIENVRQKLVDVPKSDAHRRKLSEAIKKQWQKRKA